MYTAIKFIVPESGVEPLSHVFQTRALTTSATPANSFTIYILQYMCGLDRTRTCDICDVNATLYQLSYKPISLWAGEELNLHGLPHTHLKRTRIPIPPPAQTYPKFYQTGAVWAREDLNLHSLLKGTGS